MGRSKGYRKRGGYRDAYWQNAAYNQAVFETYRDSIESMALMRFKWNGLPETCDARFLEWTLYHNGIATIAKNPETGCFETLAAVVQGAPNQYDQPRAWRARGWNGIPDYHCDWSSGVVVFDNATRFPVAAKADVFARELADIMKTKQINRFHQRMPVVITGASEQAFDMQNLLRQISMGEPAIITTNGISNIDVRVWDTGIEYLGDKLDAEAEATWRTLCSHVLGIEMIPYKGERMIEDEVASVTMSTEMLRLDPLSCRRAAAEKLNERFGLGIEVVWNSDTATDNWNWFHDVQERADDAVPR